MKTRELGLSLERIWKAAAKLRHGMGIYNVCSGPAWADSEQGEGSVGQAKKSLTGSPP